MVSTAAFHARVRGSVPGLGGLKETKMYLPHPRVRSLRDQEVACSDFESCVWRTVSSHSSHHPHEVLLAQFSLYVHNGGLKPDSFHFILTQKKIPDLLLKIENVALERVKTFNFLSITLHEHLKLYTHINNISNQIYRVIGTINS